MARGHSRKAGLAVAASISHAIPCACSISYFEGWAVRRPDSCPGAGRTAGATPDASVVASPSPAPGDPRAVRKRAGPTSARWRSLERADHVVGPAHGVVPGHEHGLGREACGGERDQVAAV